MSKSIVDVFLIFHNEGFFAVPAIKSAIDLVREAEQHGSVRLIAVLDTADSVTIEIVESKKEAFHAIHFVDFGDLGMTRNFCVEKASGTHIAMLDGDDLWGESWIAKSILHKGGSQPNTVLHPEYLFYFSEEDLLSSGGSRKSFFIKHQSSRESKDVAKHLYLSNLWSANNFMPLELARKFPYRPTDKSLGLGVEDWSWNLETVSNNVIHDVVPGTVHFIRQKPTGSLGIQNSLEGLSIYLPEIRK